MNAQFKFQVGYNDHLHPMPSINFQLNRWINYLGTSALDELQAVAPRLTDFPSYRREFLSLAEKALAEGRKLHAAYYFRSAEFFMWRDDPAKQPTRHKFLELALEHYGIKESDCHAIPYQDGDVRADLPAYRFVPEKPKDTIVLFGGGDSYIEEFLPFLLAFRDLGYDVVCFEGPGQGRVLEEGGVPMTPDWHKPVKAVLDYFSLIDVTLIGISMGGCLVLRAAAYEPRARRVIVYGIYYDTRKMRRSVSPFARFVLGSLFAVKAAPLYNSILRRAMKTNLNLNWMLHQGMHMLGAQTPYEYVQKAGEYRTWDVSHMLQQDVLLLAGTEDFIVPLEQFYWQIEALKNVRSLTARMFTRAEQAQNHCQVGNLGLAIDVITNWIEFTRQHAN
jgi:pimeloyl-ACP methyl ester carboxylesterase